MKILLICGSLRRGSFNGLLEQKAAELLAPYAETEILHYGDLPLFNADEIYPFGKEADHVRKAIAQADGLWFFSLEYNGSFTGVLKNLLDYASMTYINGDYSSGTPLKGKPVIISAAAGKMAAAGSVAHLSTLLKTLGCQLMEEPQVRIALPAEAFTTGQWQPTAEQIDLLRKQAEAFVQFVRETETEQAD